MAATIKNLYEGTLPAAKTTLYTVPPGTTAVVLNILCVNADAAIRTIDLYYKKASSSSRRLCPPAKPMAVGEKFTVEEKITMGAGDIIEGGSDGAGVVDTVISGVERT